jgi:hypothetical protein
MERSSRISGILLAAMSLASIMQSAHAQPPDVVSSDASDNTASGTNALLNLSGGWDNSAFGLTALKLNSSGSYNTAVGSGAMTSNTMGWYNTAVGYASLQSNTDASNNTATGVFSLWKNTAGENNTAFGPYALQANTAGNDNDAQGFKALYSNTTGIDNLGIGSNALYGNVTGSYNIALGFNAGYNQTSGNDNIYLANQGVAGESQTLRLGTQGTRGVVGSGILSAYIAGVATSQVTGSAVYITSSGQLGVLASSERFKTDVASMGAASEKLAQLRPVTFRLKTDPTGATQYGLIAEEVAKVYPELVIHGADGRIDAVRYEELAPMLLNGVQQRQAQIAAQANDLAVQGQKLDSQAETIRNLEAQLAQLIQFKQSMLTAMRELRPQENLVAWAE